MHKFHLCILMEWWENREIKHFGVLVPGEKIKKDVINNSGHQGRLCSNPLGLVYLPVNKSPCTWLEEKKKKINFGRYSHPGSTLLLQPSIAVPPAVFVLSCISSIKLPPQNNRQKKKVDFFYSISFFFFFSHRKRAGGMFPQQPQRHTDKPRVEKPQTFSHYHCCFSPGGTEQTGRHTHTRENISIRTRQTHGCLKLA